MKRELQPVAVAFDFAPDEVEGLRSSIDPHGYLTESRYARIGAPNLAARLVDDFITAGLRVHAKRQVGGLDPPGTARSLVRTGRPGGNYRQTCARNCGADQGELRKDSGECHELNLVGYENWRAWRGQASGHDLG